jgi:hypothetical protein
MNPYYQAHFRDLMLLEKELRNMSSNKPKPEASDIKVPSDEPSRKRLVKKMIGIRRKYDQRIKAHNNTLIGKIVWLSFVLTLILIATCIIGKYYIWNYYQKSKGALITMYRTIAILTVIGSMMYAISRTIQQYNNLLTAKEAAPHPLKKLETVSVSLPAKSEESTLNTNQDTLKDKIKTFMNEYHNIFTGEKATLDDYDALKEVKQFFDAEDATLALRYNRQKYRAYVDSNIESLLKALTDAGTCMFGNLSENKLCDVPSTLGGIVDSYMRGFSRSGMTLSTSFTCLGSGSGLELGGNSGSGSGSGSVSYSMDAPTKEDLEQFMKELNEQITNGNIRPKHIMHMRNNTVMYGFLKFIVSNTLGDLYTSIPVDTIVDKMRSIAVRHQAGDSSQNWKDWYVQKNVSEGQEDSTKTVESLNAQAIANMSKVMNNIRALLNAVVTDLKADDFSQSNPTKYVEKGTYIDIMLNTSLDALVQRQKRMANTLTMFDNLDKTEFMRVMSMDTKATYNHVYWTWFAGGTLLSTIKLIDVIVGMRKAMNDDNITS